MSYAVNMTDPEDPVYEVATGRVIRMVRGNKKFVDAIIAATAAERAKNWKFALVKKNRDFVFVVDRLKNDVTFKKYLMKHLSEAFDSAFANNLVKVFSEK